MLPIWTLLVKIFWAKHKESESHFQNHSSTVNTIGIILLKVDHLSIVGGWQIEYLIFCLSLAQKKHIPGPQGSQATDITKRSHFLKLKEN